VAERSFKKEVQSLRLGEGDVFEGEGILAVTKALLQSGVSYVGGYPGAPVSHLCDVLNDAQDILDDLGVHLENCANEAGAAAMLGASINYPLRGAVTWKSIVGTNVASDALSNLASAGVLGGSLVIIGEDYGEGASIIQERTHAYAMKSQIWLLDPRPNLPTIVDMVEQGFRLSEVSNTPVMLELRIRACHVTGRFRCKDNRPPRYSRKTFIQDPSFDYGRVCLPPSTYSQEKHKVEVRWPAAVAFIRDNRLNETFEGDLDEVGIITQGGMYNGVVRALHILGLADAFGAARVPIHVLNVTYPLVPEEIAAFCAGKRDVLVVEEGQPAYIEEAVNAALRKADVNARVMGKGPLPKAGEYTGEVLLEGIARFLEQAAPGGVDAAPLRAAVEGIVQRKAEAQKLLGGSVPVRPPSFCTGCPERPVFSAMKLVERELGPMHVSADIGCHSFSSLPPFNIGNTILGYGLGLASSTGLRSAMGRPVVSIMGDGGFWHNGLTSGVANHVFNEDDGVLIIMKNGYAAATGHQQIPSTGVNPRRHPTGMSIPAALKGVGVKWIRTVRSYSVARMARTLKEALTTDKPGLKVVIADGECQLARQRRLKPLVARKLGAGERVVRTRFGVDEDTCTGDHSCIRLSGCPSLTIKPNPDPLRRDPVASVVDSCVGCGLCGEVAHAAVLCPSFYQADIIRNPRPWDRWLDGLRRRYIAALQGGRAGEEAA
jgi:indolepyruvate ferredoxin oxidoreductase alpha subunit